MTHIKNIIFDLGGVLIDWNPEYVYDENYFESQEKKEYFFNHVCTNDWNEEQDAGGCIVESTQQRIAKFPEWEQPIRDYYGRWTEMLGGPIAENVSVFKEIRESGKYNLYALTNWQADLFKIALVRYNFLHWFDGRVVSGEEKMRKPFPEFYEVLFNRYSVNPAETLFIDDNLRNIEAGEKLGLTCVHLPVASELRSKLQSLGIL